MCSICVLCGHQHYSCKRGKAEKGGRLSERGNRGDAEKEKNEREAEREKGRYTEKVRPKQ